MSNLSTLPKGDSAWLLRKAIQRVMQQVSVLETNIGASTTGNSANSQVIFNDDGTLRGDPDLIFNTALNKLVVTNLEATAALTVGTTATITGDLTVDTNTFAVDASTNRVFVGTAPISTAYPFYVTRGGTAGSIAQFTDGTAQTLTIDSAAGGLIVGNANNGYLEFVANGLAQYRIAPLGVFSWYDGAGGTRMTLNSTGLGLGIAPSAWGSNSRAIQVGGGSASVSSTGAGSTASRFAHNTYFDNTNWKYKDTGVGPALYEMTGANTGSTHAWYISAGGTAGNNITFIQAMTLDASGNLGVGITNPSFRFHALVSSGADRDIFAAQVLAASNGLQVKWNHATTTLRIILANIPTSSAGLATGTLWNDAGTIKIA